MPSNVLPAKGPVEIENVRKNVFSFDFFTGDDENPIKRIYVGSELDRDAAVQWEMQNAENERQKANDPRVKSFDRRTRVHNPIVEVSAADWKLIMESPTAKPFLAGKLRDRDIRISRA